ncbi:MAG: hypothetical protein ACLFNT_07950, partial [Spirochaetales bacterium]
MEAISQAEPRETGRFTFKKMLEGMDVVGRVTRMTFHYPWRMTAAIGALLAAVAFQLYIPEFLGDAVDNARGLLAEGPSADASRALVITGALLFGTSVLRGLFTMLHNYIGESVGQHIGYELRMAIYD